MLASHFPVLFPTSRTPASVAFGQLSYVVESSQGELPSSGDSCALRVISHTLKPAIATLKSSEIGPTRMARTSVNVDLDVVGGFEFELSYGTCDPFLESAVCGAWAFYGDSGLGDPFDVSTTAAEVTASVAPTGASAFALLAPGSWFKLVPPPSTSSGTRAYFARRWLRVNSTTTTKITLDPSTQLSGLGLASLTGCRVSQATLVNGNEVKSFYLEWAQTDVRHYFQYSGMRVNKLDLKLDKNSLITGALDFTGMGHTLTGSSVLPGQVVQPPPPEVMNTSTSVVLSLERGMDLQVTGSFVTALNFNISNNLRGQKAIGVFGSAGIGVGELSVSGSVDVYLSDSTLYRKWLAGQEASLTFAASDSVGGGYLVELNKVKFRDLTLPGINKGTDMIVSVAFDAFYDSTTRRGIRITKTTA